MEEIVRVDLNGNVIERSESCLHCIKQLECKKRKAVIDDETFFDKYLDCENTMDGIRKYLEDESKLMPCDDFKDKLEGTGLVRRVL